MQDHRTGRDPAPQDITRQIRAIAGRGAALRVTPPDWRIGQPKTKTKTTKKTRRQQQAASRKRNR